MTTALAAQLAQINSNIKEAVDLKAQKAAHSKSLIFEPRIAATQNFQTLYSICREGFDDLCRLDAHFVSFGTTIFSEQSRDEDRSQMTQDENAELDKKIESFLRLVGSRLRLSPAIKALEWLIRRFRIHQYNTAMLIATFLPYHSLPAFTTLLDILPSTLPAEFRFLDPYKRSLTQPPRSVLVHRATHHPEFMSVISQYTLQSCRSQQHYPVLISFWASIMLEAVTGMLDMMRSGRRSVQKSNDQALLHQIGPVLSEALVMDKVSDLQIAAYMITVAYVSHGDLDDAVITALMDQVVEGWTPSTVRPGLVCLSILAHHRSAKQTSRKTTKALLKISGLSDMLVVIGKEHTVEKLAYGFCVALVDRLVRKGEANGLPIVESVISKQILSEQQLGFVVKSLILAAHKTEDDVDDEGRARKALASTIVRLSQAAGDTGRVFAKTIEDTGFDVEELEMKLGTAIRPKLIASQTQPEAMDEDLEIAITTEDFSSGFERLNNPPETHLDSCLSSSPPDIFTDLCSLYLTACNSPENLTAFETVASLQSSQATNGTFFFTFFMRIWCSPRYPALARRSALQMVKERLKSADCTTIDFQAMVPYCIAALSDPSKKVRRAAADLVAVIDALCEQHDGRTRITWGLEKLYNATESTERMSTETARKMLQNVVVPSLEECVLNADHIHAVVQNALNSSSRASVDGSGKDRKGHLSHGTRLSVFAFLAAHVIQTPLIIVKLRLLKAMNQVKGVSGTTRTELLLPLLQWWVSLPTETIDSICIAEDIEQSTMDEAVMDILLPNERAGLDFLLEVVQKPEMNSRPAFVRAAFGRIKKMWSSMKLDAKHNVAEKLLELTLEDPSGDVSAVSAEAADLLKNVELTTDILLVFLESLESAAKLAVEFPSTKRRRLSSSENMQTDLPPSKRRRSSSSASKPTESLSPSHKQNRTSSLEVDGPVATQLPLKVIQALKQVTFILQIVEGSEPAKHPQLLNALFNTLSELQHFRALLGSEHGYLQKLVLDSLLAMMPAYENDKSLKIDGSGGYGDLLVTCIQKSSSPAVQKTALLLVARLANVAPDLVLNSVMPIFTFMGSSVLRQSDDYSAHVINQTVEQVVPPLIASLRKGKRSPVAGASEILLSFVTAFEHIPSHRRLGLFVSLVKTAGAEDFLFALLAMLVNKYGFTGEVLRFAGEVFNYFEVEVQFQSLIKHVSLIGDIFQSKRTLSTVLLGAGEDNKQDPQKIALSQLNMLPHLLSSRKLTAHVSTLAERDDMDAAKIRELYASLLKDILSLAETLKPYKALHSRCGDAVSKMLNLLSIGEFIKSVETLLDRPDAVVRRKVLRALQDRIDQERQANAAARSALLAFLPQLTAIIRASDDMPYKHIAVECVDKIAEKFGKKDPEAVTAAAETIAGDQCLGQSDVRLRIMALCCLASLVDVLQDGIVQILPIAIPKCLAYMKESVENGSADAELPKASYALMTALAQHLPYMVSKSYLTQLLAISSASAEHNVAGEARIECLQSLAKQLDAKLMFSALEANWSIATESGFTATKEYLDILGVAIDKHTKLTIAKNGQLLSTIFRAAFDLRREQCTKSNESFTPGHLSRIEDTTNAVALRMIFKLNDASFRPIFSQLMDWAVALPESDSTGRNLRLLSVFNFLIAFFDSLKAAVTSYASYVIEAAVGVLRTANLRNQEQVELWKKVLHTLSKCFEHDNDDIKFWQAPAHFGAVAPALTAQFAHAAAGVDLYQDLFPAVVELAAAADSRDHWKELNGALLKHLRSEHAAVRLAAVKCEQALWERLGGADEWQDMLPETGPYLSELQEDDDEEVERETHRWIVVIEGKMGTQLDGMLQ
ncbi:U3 small nucleolar RNA-associated protein 10 [Pseudomassariella vexata]|uniref:U3 small nucleolar RNA-associated protein 10 n=1 Tax=Pseudomassariella vexata TaxID=1141098 RepID=A0A1Y2DIL6_9PEZI|nr:U3 small nucleolar RNA-associated protein 10 [Pseudomassariella vexata]ORY59070.1 U3 small nucleolar RNA-associated protein 10 [Pseudomassariella vexata]